MANVGRISGPLLKANLVRNGIDLAVEGDLLYVDVNNSRIGINNSSPAYDLDVTGTSQTTLLLAGQATVDNVDINNNDITVLSGNLRLTGFGTTDAVELNDLLFTQNEITTVTDGDNILVNTGTNSSVVINGRLTINDAANADTKLAYGSVSINGETTEALIETTTTDLDLELSSNGLGKVITNSNTQIGPTGDPKNLTVTGNTLINGNLTVEGNITIGDQDTDSLIIGADLESNIVPDASDTYDLGTATKAWRDVFVGDLQLTTNSVTATVTNDDVRLTPNGTGNVVADTTKSLVVPIGTSLERPADTTGAIRWNTTNESYEAFDARTGINDWAVIPLGQAITRYQFTATAGQTVFSGADDNGNTLSPIPGGTEFVFQNGQFLEETQEYTSDATSITLVTGATAGDDINIVTVGTFKVSDVVAKSTGGTFDAGVIVDGNFSVLNNMFVDGSAAIADRIIAIGTGPSGTAPSSDDNQDRGVNFKWHDGGNPKNGFFGFDDSTGYFTFVPDATITGEVVSGTSGTIQATTFIGDLTGNVTGNVTGDVTGDLTGNADTASTWKTPRTFELTGAVTGTVTGVDGSGNVSIATTATSDPTLTLTGDATGTATFTDLGDATLTVSITGGSAASAGTATTWETPRTFELTGAVTGTVTGVDGSSDVTINTTATSDPTLTLTGDATGTATFTDLGDATLTVSVGNADTATAWETARTVELTGAVTGTATGVDGTSNISISTSASPVLTLDGDATGTATFTDLGNATLTVTVDGGNAQTLDSLDSTDFTLNRVTNNGSTTTNNISVGNISANTVTATFVGGLTGDVIGSVFGDDSTVLVDGVNNTIPGYVSLQTLKDVTAASVDFADFQTRIANL